MRTAIADRLAGIDPNQLRAAPEEMRRALVSVVNNARDGWTCDWSELVWTLHDVARVDLCLGRLVEGHADACRILDEVGSARFDGVYGVWASRSAGTGLVARERSAGWSLSGQVRFASGVDLIDRVLVPGWTDAGHHFLFDVPIEIFEPDRTSWATAAMDGSRSFTCVCDDVDAGVPIGGQDFYLSRLGFAIGGLGPAAVWLGGAQQVADLVGDGVSRFAVSHHQARRLGVIEHAVWVARAALDTTAAGLDTGLEPDPALTVSHTRTAIVDACDTVVTEAALIVGPGGLGTNARLSRAIADLAIYIRQHHLDSSMQAYGDAALVRRQANLS